MSDATNPTTKNGESPANAPSHFRVQLDYDPVSGEFGISGNVHDPLVMHGILGMAAVAFERSMARRLASSISLPPAIPRRSS